MRVSPGGSGDSQGNAQRGHRGSELRPRAARGVRTTPHFGEGQSRAHVPGPRPADPRAADGQASGTRVWRSQGGAEPRGRTGSRCAAFSARGAPRRVGSGGRGVCLRLRPGAGGAHGAAAGLRVPEPDGERGAGPAWAEAASFPCALPAPPPRRCRQQSGPGARAGLGRARGRRRFSGCAASVAPPFPGQAAASLRGRSVLGASSAVFAGRAALFIYFSKWVLVTGRKLGNSLGLAQSVERGTLDLRVSSGPLLGVEITRKDQL